LIKSTCYEGKWDCGNIDCMTTVKCPNNQIYSKNASSCLKTCGTRDFNNNCEAIFEGCTCPEGTILDYNVLYHNFNKKINVINFIEFLCS
jgi:hypothetical protein